MKHIIKIILLISTISCNDINTNSSTNINDSTPNKQTYIKQIDSDSTSIIVNKEQWIKDAELYLSLEEGEEIIIKKNTPSATKKVKKEGVNKFKPLIDADESNNDVNNNFEYSDKWRKEAFKASKKFVRQILDNNKPRCKVVSQSVYNPSRVQYLGGKTYEVIIKSKFDCNQDYINDCTFIIRADYLGNNNWDFDVIKQRFND